MNTSDFKQHNLEKTIGDTRQKGSALVIAVLILALISVFVALALSRSASEAAAIGNETAEGRTFYAAQGSLEMMTRNFNKIFEVKINPTDDDINTVKTSPVLGPGLSSPNYTFTQELDRTSNSTTVVLPGGPYAGLYAIRDNWRLRTTATNANGVQVQLTRNLLNNRIPIFQFGIFYDDDLELYRPPRFAFGGRVHTNGNFFLSPGTEGIYFDSRVTAVGQIITQSWRNGYTGDSGNNQTFIKNASAVDKQLLPNKASVLNTTAGASDNVFASKPDMPPSKLNPTWASDSAIFDGNLQTTGAGTELNLPVKVGTNTDLIELIKRGKKAASAAGGDLFKNDAGNLAPVTTDDDDILRAERYANKTGIRVSLGDSKAKLPGCASGVGTGAIAGLCGVRLDGASDGTGDVPTSGSYSLRVRGYQPKSMKTTTGGSYSYTPTRINGERLYTGREVWIKVETVATDPSNGAILTKDITQDILSLGMTEQAPRIVNGNTTKFEITGNGYDETPPSSSLTATTAQTGSNVSTGTDSRSVIKIQRFVIPGPEILGGSGNYLNYYSNPSGYNVVVRYSGVNDTKIAAGCTSGCTTVNTDPNSSLENYAHLKRATVDGVANNAIVPIPIEMFDTREGTFYDQANLYASNKVTRMGAMSVIDIDVANLRRFLRGDFDGLFPTDTSFALGNGSVGLKSTDIPNNGGWVMYVSDRRGDADFDGEFDMEDIYGYGYNSSTKRYYGSDGILELGEDVNKNGKLDVDFGNEAPNKYDDDIYSDLAAVTDLKYYRRGVRLINGTIIPGIYDAVTAANTKGFTLASENGVYIDGNYDATGVASVPATGNTPYSDYLPFNTATHIPASVVADSVTVLSNAWNDAESFAYPYDLTQRKATDTTVRCAIISGDTIANKQSDPNQGGISPNLNGGVHNFKRFLERWTDPNDTSFKKNLNYSGSLINLFNSHNNNGSFKCCNTVYNPPIRNWVFDSTFLDAGRLPPGTPFFQYVQITGFQRTND